MSTLTLGNGSEMYYELHGGAPRTVMMIHGLGACGHFWTRHIEPLVEAGWRVLIADWPGSGRSGPCESDLDLYADSFIKLAKHAGAWKQPLAICGHSAGGALAQMIYDRAPARVSALVLTQTGSRFIDPRLAPLVNKALPSAARAVYRPPFTNAASAALALIRKNASLFLSDGDPAAILLEVGDLASRGQNSAADTCALAKLDLSDRLCEISAPTLIIGARVDPVVPLQKLRLMQQAIPNSELRILEHFGHNACLLHHRESTAFILDFLSRHFPD